MPKEPSMGPDLNLLGCHAAWLGWGHAPPMVWRVAAWGLAAAVPVFSEPLLLGLSIVAFLFFVLWVTAWSRNHRHLGERQMLQFELLSRDEELKREKSDLAAVREALRSHAIRDELTGQLNRTSIVELLEREMARAVRDKSTLSVVLADVDHLKKINESHSEAAGDEVLKEVGRRLEHAIRNYDSAGRYEGGEFLLVLPSFEADTGVERLRKIHDSICGKPILFNNMALNVTCSFGVSILLPSHFYSSEELLERASQAMMTAKHDGRNRIGFFARSGN
jgi:diguanylate cyclase (GGDEF)-like protein